VQLYTGSTTVRRHSDDHNELGYAFSAAAPWTTSHYARYLKDMHIFSSDARVVPLLFLAQG